MKNYLKILRIAVIIATILIIAIWENALADGFIVPGSSHTDINEPGQKAVIVWDKKDKIETLALSVAIQSKNISNMCWITPIKSTTEPEVSSANNMIFNIMEKLFPIRFLGTEILLIDTMNGGLGGIEVLSFEEIDVYDYIFS